MEKELTVLLATDFKLRDLSLLIMPQDLSFLITFLHSSRAFLLTVPATH